MFYTYGLVNFIIITSLNAFLTLMKEYVVIVYNQENYLTVLFIIKFLMWFIVKFYI